MTTRKIFLASASELIEDRREFEIFINRKNKDWVAKGVFLHLDVWEDFLDAVSQTRLQDEYNKAIGECDIFVMLFFTKVGKYTEEEFETAFGQFKATNKPFIFTYFRDAQISTGSASKSDLMSLSAFQEKLKALGHFQTEYKNIDALKFHFNQQLDKLAASGFLDGTAIVATNCIGTPAASRKAISDVTELFESLEPFWRLGLGDAALLRAEQQVVPFHEDAKPLLEELSQWAKHPQRDIALQIWAGPAGAGKTRLLIEVCTRLSTEGWEAGFLRSTPPSDQRETCLQWWNLGDCPRFVVIDYAEARPNEVTCLLETLLKSSVKRKSRIVLLARNTQSWWFELICKSKLVRALAEGDNFSGMRWITPIALGEQQALTHFDAAIDSFARVLGRAPSEFSDCEPPTFLDETQGEPLYAHMAALAAIRGEKPATLRSLLASTLQRERSFWIRLLERFGLDGVYLNAFCQSIAAITLLGGCSGRSPAIAVLLALPETNGLTAGERQTLIGALSLAYPRGAGIDALRPDRLGEVLVLEEFRRDGSLIDAVENFCATQRDFLHVLAIVERITARLVPALDADDIDQLARIQDKLFRVVRPRTAHIIERAIRRTGRGHLAKWGMRLQDQAKRVLAESGIEGDVFSHMLSVHEVYSRMKAERLSYSQVFDLLSIEVVVDDAARCYLAMGVLSQRWKPLPGRVEDYIAMPNVYGYRAIHCTLIGSNGIPFVARIYSKEMARLNGEMPAGYWSR